MLVFAGAVTGFVWWRWEALPADAAFRVGDRVVTKEEFDRRVDTLRALYGVQPPIEERQFDRFRRDSAKAIAVSIVLDEQAKQQGVVVADKSARDVLSRLVESQLPGGGPEARKQFIAALGSAGTSELAVVDEIKRQMAVSQLFNRVTAGTSVSEQELRDAFDKRHDQLGQPEQRRLRNIVVADRGEAEALIGQVRGGAAFPALAAQRSLDGGTRAQGGELGTVSAQQLEPEYAKAAFAVPVGTVFGPVQSQFGWNVGQVDEVIPGSPVSFNAIKGELGKQLESEKALQRWRSWLQDQIANADLDYTEAYRPPDPLSPPDVGGSAPGSVSGIDQGGGNTPR
ncbi:peptidyl-prolyl cis-trans isomerase [Saccharopolyspora sp. NPDC049426]|uniref:peptidylprolyl isomerase n=1 Tax=Saccharopolyspora sp. NPDC049426 TaxID=3155652 RepID=UPI003430665D